MLIGECILNAWKVYVVRVVMSIECLKSIKKQLKIQGKYFCQDAYKVNIQGKYFSQEQCYHSGSGSQHVAPQAKGWPATVKQVDRQEAGRIKKTNSNLYFVKVYCFRKKNPQTHTCNDIGSL